MVTPWEKKVIWKSIGISFIIENPKKIFNSREIHHRELRSHKNHRNWFLRRKSQKNQLQQREFRENSFPDWKFEKKEFLFFCKILRTKYVDAKIMQQVCFENSPGNQFHGEKFRGRCFDSKNLMETNLDQKDLTQFVNEKFPEVCSAKIDSMKTACINGETRTNTISFTGTPDGPISYKCNARQLVFLEENPPISSIGNTRKFFSTTKMCWKSISSEKNLIHNLPWKNAHGKTSVDSFSL